MNPSTGLTPKQITGFNGLYKRGAEVNCPPDHLTDCYNCIFPGKDQVSIRESISISSGNLLAGFVQSYAIAQVANNPCLLTLGDGTSDFYDETHTFLLGNFPNADDFICLSIFGRSYIAFKQTGRAWGVSGTCNVGTSVSGYSSAVNITSGSIGTYMVGGGILINNVPCSILTRSSGTTITVDHDFGSHTGYTYSCSNVFSYNGDFTIGLVPAGGRKPENNTITLGSFGGGYNTPGQHQISFCYQYVNGYLSPPTGAPYNAVNNALGTGYTVAFTDTPPANVVARVLISTQAIPFTTFTFDKFQSEAFFVPGGTIPVGTTSANISFYDTDLIASADYLFDISPYIPGASSLRFYHGRMVVIGQYSFPDNILVSDQLIPESINGVTGIVNMPVDYGLNTSSTAAIIRDVLYVMKPNSTYSVQDNGGTPDTWAVTAVDTGIGAWDNGLSVFASSFSAQDVLDTSLVVNKTGLMLFNGTYSDTPLTYKIESIWQLIPPANFYLCQIAHDTVLKRAYILVPLNQAPIPGGQISAPGSGPSNILLMMDYQEGLNPQAVKWSVWFYDNFGAPNFIRKISVENFTLNYGAPTPVYQFTYCSSDANIYKIVPPAASPSVAPTPDFAFLGGSALNIEQCIITSVLSYGVGISLFTMLTTDMFGSNLVALLAFTSNREVNTALGLSLRGFNLSSYQTTHLYSLQTGIRFESEGMQICIRALPNPLFPTTFPAYFHLTRMAIYGKLKYNMRPALLESN